MNGYCLLPHTLVKLSLPSYGAQAYWPSDGSYSRGLGPPTSIIYLDNLSQMCLPGQSDLGNSSIEVLSSQVS